jgi:hypothetical protein
MADEQTMYAWTPIYAGGEAKEIKGPGGVVRNIISNRNVIPVGSEVTIEDLCADAPDPEREFQAYVESGAIRPYEFPKDLDPNSTESPIEFLRRQLREAAEVELDEEQQLLLATGQGAVVTDQQLAESQPKTLAEAQKAGNTAAKDEGTTKSGSK